MRLRSIVLGSVCLLATSSTFAAAGPSELVPSSATAAAPFIPTRFLDTRANANTIDGRYAATGPLAANSVTTLRITGRGDIPDNAGSVSLNVTSLNAHNAGYATIYPCGTTPPNASNLNFTAGPDATSNAVLTKIGTDGTICITTSTHTDLIIDINGAFPPNAFTSFIPTRFLDTRANVSPPSSHSDHGLPVDVSAIPAPAAGSSLRRISQSSHSPRAGDGAFRVNCHFSHMNFDDPIVFPGQRAATHLHVFFGNTGIDAFADSESVAARANSTCTGGIINRSAYWAPAVIDTATGRPIAPTGAHALQAYYKVGYQGVAPSQIRQMPAGLRIVAGNARSTTEQSSPGTGQPRPVLYSCLSTSGSLPSFPQCAPGDTFVMSVVFPQCWDGMNLDSADHKSHMAYGTWGRTPGRDGAGCPASHPVALPEMTQNFRYLVPPSGMSSWRLSSDTYSGPAGHSGHADWWNGWDESVFDHVIRNCLRPNLDCQMNLLGDGRHLN